MIKIIENNSNNITICEYPTQYWLAFLCLTVFMVLMSYWTLYYAPIYSSLNCHKTLLNATNCELVESSLLNSDLRHQTIKNLKSPKSILNNGIIWLNTETDLLHNRIQNNYYPSDYFLNIYLYRFRSQALKEVNRIDNFIRDRGDKANLVITRKIFPLLYVPLLSLPLAILPGIVIPLVIPIKTYLFDTEQKQLKSVFRNILGTMETTTYPFNELTLLSSSDRNYYSISILRNEKVILKLKFYHNEIKKFNIFKTI